MSFVITGVVPLLIVAIGAVCMYFTYEKAYKLYRMELPDGKRRGRRDFAAVSRYVQYGIEPEHYLPRMLELFQLFRLIAVTFVVLFGYCAVIAALHAFNSNDSIMTVCAVLLMAVSVYNGWKVHRCNTGIKHLSDRDS